ncbi:MAG: hypothetical protein KA715_02960 [Xanthomonadaceae bacterium]|nr:hypothetical protein [Xanthomonadaceae bacterium]
MNKKSTLHSNLEDLKNISYKATQQARDEILNSKVRTAYCRRTKKFTDQEINEYLNERSSDPAAMLEAFQSLIRLPYPDECEDARCAAKKVFGNTSDKHLFMLLKFGFNGSHFQEENLVQYESTEIDELLLMLSSYPQSVLHFEKNIPLVKYKPGTVRPEDIEEDKKLKETGADGGIYANAHITLYEKWFKISQTKRELILFHEIGHRINFKKLISNSKDWSEYNTQSESISTWGERNSEEDFADSITFYRYAPEELKKLNINKYNLIKDKVFSGIEFTDGTKCVSGYDDQIKKRELKLKSEEDGFVEWYRKYRETYVPDSDHDNRVKNFCSIELSQYMRGAKKEVTEKSELYQCIARVHSQTLFLKAITEYSKKSESDSPDLLKTRLRAKKELSEALLSPHLIQKEVNRLIKL